MTKAVSYTKERMGLIGRASELIHLYRFHTLNRKQAVARLIGDLRAVETILEASLGGRLEGRRILEIGPGQQLNRACFFAISNQVVAIDLDAILPGIDLRGYLQMYRSNGSMRTLKTVGRHLLRLDQSFRDELFRQLGVSTQPEVTVLQGDATCIDLPPDSFDVVVSFTTFEHLSDPEAVMAEAARLLRPGGVAYLDVHLYTSDSGIHDARIFSGRRDGIPLWSHLRPRYQHLTRPNTFLNRIRLNEYRVMFERQMPGVGFRYHSSLQLTEELQTLRTAGELSGYTDEELLTDVLAAVWTKPPSGLRSQGPASP